MKKTVEIFRFNRESKMVMVGFETTDYFSFDKELEKELWKAFEEDRKVEVEVDLENHKITKIISKKASR